MKFFVFLFLLFSGLACTRPTESLKPAANSAIENVTCPNSQSRLYDVIYASLIDLHRIPSQAEMRDVFESALESKPTREMKIDQKKFLELITEFYSLLLDSESAETPGDLLAKVSALEIGDQSSTWAIQKQKALAKFRKKWTEFSAAQDLECSEQVEESTGSGTLGSLVYGARKVLATAYQSCEANELPPVSSRTPDAEGISKVGMHPDGIGFKREITDLVALQRTHFYLQTLPPSQGCFDVSSNPLIYDYGGKPFTTSAPDSSLDLFRNMGTGTAVLGVDCSGYVFSAIASAGLKLDPTKKMKAVFVHGISARMYMNPESNGLPCFEKVKMGSGGTLKAGDVVALPGHVFIVESVGSDPFDLASIRTIDQCETIEARDFDFVIAQSSPNKNGMGINKYEGADYLAEQPNVRQGFEAIARQACYAKFQGRDVLMTAADFQIVRHKGTAACLDKPLQLAGESCVKSCRSLAADNAIH